MVLLDELGSKRCVAARVVLGEQPRQAGIVTRVGEDARPVGATVSGDDAMQADLLYSSSGGTSEHTRGRDPGCSPLG